MTDADDYRRTAFLSVVPEGKLTFGTLRIGWLAPRLITNERRANAETHCAAPALEPFGVLTHCPLPPHYLSVMNRQVL